MGRLSRQTAGVIGLGRIGREFVFRARAVFGQVLACDPFVAPDVFASSRCPIGWPGRAAQAV